MGAPLLAMACRHAACPAACLAPCPEEHPGPINRPFRLHAATPPTRREPLTHHCPRLLRRAPVGACRAYHKPLFMFGLTELLARAAHFLMYLMGFRPGRQGHFTYWHAPPLAGKAAAAAGAAQLPLSPPLSPAPLRGAGALRRHSTSEVVAGAVHHAAGAVHNAAEHALDATLTVTSTAAAVVAAQHPHGQPTPLSPQARRPSSPAPLRSPGMASAPAARAASSPPGLVLPEAAVAAHSAGVLATGAAEAAAGSSLRRRAKNDSAAEFVLAAAADAAAGSEREDGQVEAATEAAAPASDAEVCVAASPFRLAPLETPRASPSDSAGSVGAAAAGAAGGTRPDVPVVFLHGVGFGVLPYLHLVRDIQQACANTPVLMVEVRGVPGCGVCVWKVGRGPGGGGWGEAPSVCVGRVGLWVFGGRGCSGFLQRCLNVWRFSRAQRCGASPACLWLRWGRAWAGRRM